MCLFLEILCRNLQEVKYFHITGNIFPMPKIWNYFFCSTAFVDKINTGDIIYDFLSACG